MTVLVVDDAQTVRAYHRQLLEQTGFAVDEAANGLEGLEKLQSRGTEIQAILLDINMPQMDGYTLLQEIRSDSELPQVPVIMVSTEAEAHDQDRAFQVGANGYRVKPVAAEDLATLMRHLTGRVKPEAEETV